MKEKHRMDTDALRHFTFSKKFTRSLKPKFVYSGILRKQAGWQAAEHSHEFCEILYIRSGSGRVRIAGKEFPVRAGDLVVYAPETLHGEFSAPDDPIETLFVAAAGIRLQGLPAGQLLSPDDPPVFSSGEYRVCFEELFERLIEETDKKSLFFKEIAENLLTIIIHLLLRVCVQSADFEKINDVYYRVKNYLDTHYAEQLTLDGLCETFFVSKSYLSHIFKELNGTSPMRYLSDVRLRQAERLLTTTALPVREIAERAGYPDECYFCRVFKKRTSTTPAAFRRSRAEENAGQGLGDALRNE